MYRVSETSPFERLGLLCPAGGEALTALTAEIDLVAPPGRVEPRRFTPDDEQVDGVMIAGMMDLKYYELTDHSVRAVQSFLSDTVPNYNESVLGTATSFRATKPKSGETYGVVDFDASTRRHLHNLHRDTAAALAELAGVEPDNAFGTQHRDLTVYWTSKRANEDQRAAARHIILRALPFAVTLGPPIAVSR
ncbi:MAG: hypothetical protein JWN38_1236 [Candidatus Saccharibacteria bacterium]|nr:hypothetical protein [Candidatus Saccharibacteria bacterium]